MFIDKEHHTGFALDNLDLSKRIILKNHGYTDGFDKGNLTSDGLTHNKVSVEYIRHILDTMLLLQPDNKSINIYMTLDKYLVISSDDETIQAFIAPIK